MFQIVKLQEEREAIVEKNETLKRKVTEIFDRKLKKYTFLVGDAILNRMDEEMKNVSMENSIMCGMFYQDVIFFTKFYHILGL